MLSDCIVVGEFKGAEVIDLLAAVYNGNDGGADTVHANNLGRFPPDWRRWAHSAASIGSALHSQLATAVQMLLYVVWDRAPVDGDSARSLCCAELTGGFTQPRCDTRTEG